MQALSPLSRPRRLRRSRMLRRLTLVLCGAAALAALALGAYRIGRSQAAIEVDRLTADVAAQREMHRLATLRLAEVEQQAEAAVTRHAQLLGELRRREPSPELRRLSDLAAERLRAGVSPERLAFVLAATDAEPVCAREVEARRLAVHTSAGTGPIAAATFFQDRVIVTGEGSTAPAPDGAPGRWFDPSRPVTLRFLELGGETAAANGPLPLAQALVVDGQELRFLARASEREPGLIEISAQRCQLP